MRRRSTEQRRLATRPRARSRLRRDLLSPFRKHSGPERRHRFAGKPAPSRAPDPARQNAPSERTRQQRRRPRVPRRWQSRCDPDRGAVSSVRQLRGRRPRWGWVAVNSQSDVLLSHDYGHAQDVAAEPIDGPAFMRREVSRLRSARPCNSPSAEHDVVDRHRERCSVNPNALLSCDRGHAQAADA